VPEEPFVPPSGIAVMQINPNTGVHVTSGGISEYFYQEFPATELDSEASPSEEKAATTEKR